MTTEPQTTAEPLCSLCGLTKRFRRTLCRSCYRKLRRCVLQAAASGGLPERSIADLLEAVEGLELLQLATELRTARGPARVVTALRTAVAALDLSDGALGGADSADSADRSARKRL